jgi:hypothetical protein
MIFDVAQHKVEIGFKTVIAKINFETSLVAILGGGVAAN